MKNLIPLIFVCLLPALNASAEGGGFDDGIADGRASCDFIVKQVNPNDVANVKNFHDDPHRYISPPSINYRVVGYVDGYNIGVAECGRAAVMMANNPKAAWTCLMPIEEASLSIVGTGTGDTGLAGAKVAVLSCTKGNPENPTSCFDNWIYCFHRNIQ